MTNGGEEWQQATKLIQIGQYMRSYGYDAYSKDSPNGVRAFVKQNPRVDKCYGQRTWKICKHRKYFGKRIW